MLLNLRDCPSIHSAGIFVGIFVLDIRDGYL